MQRRRSENSLYCYVILHCFQKKDKSGRKRGK
jgi:hypothetical protein